MHLEKVHAGGNVLGMLFEMGAKIFDSRLFTSVKALLHVRTVSLGHSHRGKIIQKLILALSVAKRFPQRRKLGNILFQLR